MPATKALFEPGTPKASWQQLKGWINANAHDLLNFAWAGYSEKGRGIVILAGTPRYPDADLEIRCRYIKPEEIVDIDNEALDLAHQLVSKYRPKTEFVVVTIDDIGHVTSALVAVERSSTDFVH